MQVVIRADEHLARYANQLGALGAGQAARLMAMALNSEGMIGRTRVYAALMQQTGIRKQAVTKAVKTIKAGSNRLQFKLIASSPYTNVAMFGGKQGRFNKVAGIASRKAMRVRTPSASPWNVGRSFPGTFMIPTKKGKRIFIRTGNKRYPFRHVWGPSLPREIVKAESLAEFNTIAPKVGIEVGRLLGLQLSGKVQLGASRGFVRT